MRYFALQKKTLWENMLIVALKGNKGKLSKYLEMGPCQSTFLIVSRDDSIRRMFWALLSRTWRSYLYQVFRVHKCASVERQARGGLGAALFPTHLARAMSCSVLPTSLCCCCAVTKSCPTRCDPIDCSRPGFPDTGLVCRSLLQWTTICQSSSLWPICLGGPAWHGS